MNHKSYTDCSNRCSGNLNWRTTPDIIDTGIHNINNSKRRQKTMQEVPRNKRNSNQDSERKDGTRDTEKFIENYADFTEVDHA